MKLIKEGVGSKSITVDSLMNEGHNLHQASFTRKQAISFRGGIGVRLVVVLASLVFVLLLFGRILVLIFHSGQMLDLHRGGPHVVQVEGHIWVVSSVIKDD